MDTNDTAMRTTIDQWNSRIHPSQTLTRRTGSSPPPSMLPTPLRTVPERHYKGAGCGGEADAAGCWHEPRHLVARVVALSLPLAGRARRAGCGARLGRAAAPHQPARPRRARGAAGIGRGLGGHAGHFHRLAAPTRRALAAAG